MLVIDDTIFKGFIDSNEYKSLQKDLKKSYIWDNLIIHYTEDLLTEGMVDYASGEVTTKQLALIQMALQPRYYRVILADAFIDFLEKPELNIASRVAMGYNNTAFVFLIGSGADRKARVQELGMRCLVVRGRLPNVKKVVGIATNRPGTPSKDGYSSDIVYIDIIEWSVECENQVNRIQKELKYFKKASWGS